MLRKGLIGEKELLPQLYEQLQNVYVKDIRDISQLEKMMLSTKLTDTQCKKFSEIIQSIENERSPQALHALDTALSFIASISDDVSSDPAVRKVIDFISNNNVFTKPTTFVGSRDSDPTSQILKSMEKSIEKGNGKLAIAVLERGFPLPPHILFLACEHGKENVISKFVNNTNVNQQNERGDTLLHVACKAGNTALALLLICAGADINATDSFGSNFALQFLKGLLIRDEQIDLPNSVKDQIIKSIIDDTISENSSSKLRPLDGNIVGCDKVTSSGQYPAAF